MQNCPHAELDFNPSRWASLAGYKRPSPRERVAATRPANQPKPKVKPGHKTPRSNPPSTTTTAPDPWTFPGPLCLPRDELSWDPEYPAQSFQEWLDEEDRNPVTPDRKTVYLAGVPTCSPSIAKRVNDWRRPQINQNASFPSQNDIPTPSVQHVLEYLQAFYTGLPVKLLSTPKLRFVEWKQAARPKPKPQSSMIGLHTGTEIISIRTRPSEDKLFSGQLNLDDLLDAAIAILPPDAYALLLLVDHDLYETDDDDFCCGRAYGGSRVAVVSNARYNPVLDRIQDIDCAHAWPASHCKSFMDASCAAEEDEAERQAAARIRKKFKPTPAAQPSALLAAVQAHLSLPAPVTSSALSTVWLNRVNRTASHELGHCFGLDHCVYYACIMQGTAGLAEDVRQPPYLCPVDLAKVLAATGVEERVHYERLLEYASRFEMEGDREAAAVAAWMRGRLKGLEGG